MTIPTRDVGSLPRPSRLQSAIKDFDAGKINRQQLETEQDAACLDSIRRMEQTGSPIVSDGEQRASSFATYPLTDTLAGTGLAENLAPTANTSPSSVMAITGNCRGSLAVPSDTETYASEAVAKARQMAVKPLKQAVIAPSMLSLVYPLDGEVPGYSRQQFLDELSNECEKDIRQCFDAGASRVSIDFTEGRLACKTIRAILGPAGKCSIPSLN